MITFTYYRTAKGNKRHASLYCANSLRAIASGDPIQIPADQVSKWAPCSKCTSAEAIAQETKSAPAKRGRVQVGGLWQEDVAPAKPALCPNSGVANLRKIYSTCVDCGKGGTTNRRTGTLRAHAPAK